jgi:hypothetical protein
MPERTLHAGSAAVQSLALPLDAPANLLAGCELRLAADWAQPIARSTTGPEVSASVHHPGLVLAPSASTLGSG